MTTNRRGMIAAMSALSIVALLFATALLRALTLEPVTAAAPQAAAPEDAPDRAVPVGEPGVPSETVLSSQDIALAVDLDPFLPERSRPEAYRLPGEDVLAVPEEAPAAPPMPNLQLTGTIVSGDAGVAVIQVDEAPPLVLGVGESLLGFRLENVAATTATLVNGERTVYLSLATGSPNRTSSSDRANANANQRITADVMRTLRQRFGEGFATVIEQVQQRGDQAQAQAMIEQMIQQGGRGGRSAVVRFRRDTTDVPLRTPDNR